MADTGLALISVDGTYHRALTSAAEVASALAWQAQRLQHVFLSDDLASAIALDELFRSRHGAFTSLGQLEAIAKATAHPEAVEALAISFAKFVTSTPLYEDCVVCAVPPSPHKRFDLPSEVAALVAERIGAENVSGEVRFRVEKPPIKTLPLDEKGPALRNAALAVGVVPARPILLIDDKYQSGTTANHVGRALRSAGASAVHGLFIVKTWRSRDNTASPGVQPDS